MSSLSDQRPLGVHISHMLKSRGVDVVFGIPGVHNIEMYRGIEEAGITHILARHEGGAGFMADGYARATGRPGVAYVITGPGLTNIMTPMGQAYSDSVPMLVISSCLDEVAARKGQLHQMKDQRAAAETVSDWSEEVRSATAAYQMIDRAFVEFETKRKRPKHIQVGVDLLGQSASGPGTAPTPQSAPGVPADMIQALSARLRAARRPLFIFGGGIANDRGADIARQVISQSGAACFGSHRGNGVIAADYPLNFGSSLSHPGTIDVIAQADLVIAIGTELAEVDLWRHELGHQVPLVRVDIDPVSLSDQQNADDAILTDGVTFLDRLAEHDLSGQRDWDAAEVKAQCETWQRDAEQDRPGVAPVCDALRAALPENTLIYSDMTQFAYVAKNIWPLAAPGLWHHPHGFGTLGYALPAAIGGKVGRPDQPVIAIAGDYGFQYTIQELGTAVELGLSLPIILWDNGKLKEIEENMVNAQIAPNAVEARNPDFCALAAAYGAHSASPKTLAELQSDVQTALKTAGPTLIHVTPDINDG